MIHTRSNAEQLREELQAQGEDSQVAFGHMAKSVLRFFLF